MLECECEVCNRLCHLAERRCYRTGALLFTTAENYHSHKLLYTEKALMQISLSLAERLFSVLLLLLRAGWHVFESTGHLRRRHAEEVCQASKLTRISPRFERPLSHHCDQKRDRAVKVNHARSVACSWWPALLVLAHNESVPIAGGFEIALMVELITVFFQVWWP